MSHFDGAVSPDVTPNMSVTVTRKLPQLRMSLISVIFCLIPLIITFTLLSTSMHGLQSVATNRLQQACVDREASHVNVTMEAVVVQRFQTLGEVRPQKRFFETYNECLARGISLADDVLGHEFTEYPSITNKTMDWVKTNCDRIFFAPEPPPPKRRFGPFRVHVFLRQQATVLVNKIARWIAPTWTNRTESPDTTTRKKVPLTETKHLYMPHGFRLVGCNTPPCSLAYMPPTDPPETPDTLQKSYQLALRHVEGYTILLNAIRKTEKVSRILVMTCTILQLVLMLPVLYVDTVRFFVPAIIHDNRLNGRSFWQSLVFQVVCSCACRFIDYFGCALPAAAYFSLLLVALMRAVFLLVPNDFSPHIGELYRSSRELVRHIKMAYSEKQPSPASTPTPIVKISPDTSLQEDLAATVEARKSQAEWDEVEFMIANIKQESISPEPFAGLEYASTPDSSADNGYRVPPNSPASTTTDDASFADCLDPEGVQSGAPSEQWDVLETVEWYPDPVL